MTDHQVFGITSIGRATANLLDINDPDRVQLRVEFEALGFK